MLFNKSSSNISDEAFIERYRKSGKKSHVGELFNRYAHMVLGVSMKYLKDPTAAEDATIEIFEKLFVELKSKDIDVFKAWLYTVSKNHVLMILRKHVRTREKNNQFAATYDVDLDDYEEREIQYEALERALSVLNPEQKKCLELFFLDKRSYKEIVDLTGFAMNTVKSHIQNGKRNLKIQLEQSDEFKD
jgi:RNA polymerase sigma factor (sigma-70 family)